MFFYYIVALKYPKVLEKLPSPQGFTERLRAKIAQNYMRLFIEVSQAKEKTINYILFSLGQITHYLFHRLFFSQRREFDIRFVLDCYHIITHACTGNFVADDYIRANLEKIFQRRFLDYACPKVKPVV